MLPKKVAEVGVRFEGASVVSDGVKVQNSSVSEQENTERNRDSKTIFLIVQRVS
jgi:hypothetical protein